MDGASMSHRSDDALFGLAWFQPGRATVVASVGGGLTLDRKVFAAGRVDGAV